MRTPANTALEKKCYVYTHTRHTRTAPTARKPPDWLTPVSFNDGSSTPWGEGDSETRIGIRNDMGRRLWLILSYFPAIWLTGVRKKSTISLGLHSHAKRSLFFWSVSRFQKNFRSANVHTNSSIGTRVASFVRTNERTNITGPSAGLQSLRYGEDTRSPVLTEHKEMSSICSLRFQKLNDFYRHLWGNTVA
jgi:hypothetical protein